MRIMNYFNEMKKRRNVMNVSNYYEVNEYCKSEGLDTDYFIYSIQKTNNVYDPYTL